MSAKSTSPDTINAISSPVSEDGQLRSTSPDGQKMKPSGLAHVPVSRFRALENEKVMPTNDTCGPLFTASSPSANLQRSLENRLRDLTDVNGSPEYALTWRELDMPSGLPICALRASARRIQDSGSTGWPTPTARDWRDGRSNQHGKNARPLNEVAMLLGWPTPQAMDSREHQSMESYLTRMARHTKEMTTITNLTMIVKLIGWCSPTAQDYSRGVKPPRPQDTGVPLSQQISGLMPEKSKCVTHAPAKDASGGLVLNPVFSLWLMGYKPREWKYCAERAMQSFRKLRRSLLKRRGTH